jgi:acyl-CoA synthetase (AMP-forming)/AMP-acid ligase II
VWIDLACCKNASSLVIEQGVSEDLSRIYAVLYALAELATHPHVLEVTVVARSHQKWGERPMAFVVLHPQHTARWSGRHREFAGELKTHAKTKLPGFACPEWVEVVPELPVSC